MQYMCLIYSTEGAGPQPGTPEFGAFMKGYMDFTQLVKKDGKLVVSKPRIQKTCPGVAQRSRTATIASSAPPPTSPRPPLFCSLLTHHLYTAFQSKLAKTQNRAKFPSWLHH